MFLKDNIKKLWFAISEYFLIPFCLSFFVISSLLYISNYFLLINTDKILDSILLLIISFISLSTYINLRISTQGEEENIILRRNSFINIIIVGVTLIILQICVNINLFKIILTDQITRYLIYILAYVLMVFVSIFISTDIKKQEIIEEENTPKSGNFSFYDKYKKYIIPLFVITILGCSFLIKINLVNNGNYDLDEGIHTYDAKLVLDGQTPFYDYLTREPYYLYLHAAFLKVTSVSVYNSRLMSVIATILVGLLLFIIERKFFNRSGLISLGIYSLSPFFIDKSYLANLYPLFQLIIVITLFALISFIKKRNFFRLIILGILIGASVHFYRLGIFYLFFTYSIILTVAIKEELKIKEKIFLVASSATSFLVPIIYFSILTGYKQFEVIYGTNELLVIFGISCVCLFLSKYIKKVITFITNDRLVTSIVIGIGIFCFLFIFNFFGQNIYIKSRIIFQALIEGYFYMFPLLLLLLDYIYKKTTFSFYKLSKVFIIGSIILITILGLNNKLNMQTWNVRLPSYVEIIFFIFILLSCFLMLIREKISVLKYKYIHLPFLLFSLIPFSFYFIHSQIFVFIFMFPSIFIIPIILEDVRGIILNKKWLQISLLFFLFFMPILFYFVPINDHPVPKEISNYIINDIKNIDPNGETMFTALPVYAIESSKKLIYDNSRPTIYQLNDPNNLTKLGQPSYIGLSKNTVTTEDFIKEMDFRNTKLILLDSRLGSTIGSNGILNEYINLHYKFVKNYFSKPGYQINLYTRSE